MEQKLYKGKYAICIYEKPKTKDDDDFMVAMFESVQDFANYLKTNLHNAYSMLNNNMSKKRKDIVIQNKMYELHCIKIA